MKFAKSLLRNEVPEWSQFYIDYKGLKKLVKQAAIQAHGTQGAAPHAHGNTGPAATTIGTGSDQSVHAEIVDDSITAPFFYAIDRNVEIVDNFYNSKFAEYSRRLRYVEQQCSLMWQQLTRDEADETEKEEMTRMLLELRSHLRNLQWYAEVNKRGFTKILKKFDKKVGTQAKTQYLASKINILGFSSGQETMGKIEAISKLLEDIAPHLISTDSANPSHEALTSSSQSSLTQSPFDQLRVAVDNNDANEVSRIMQTVPLNIKQVVTLILRAVGVNSDSVIPILAEKNVAQLAQGDGDINRRNIIHKVVVAEGRRQAEMKSPKMMIDAGVPAKSLGFVPSAETPDSDRTQSADEKCAHSLEVLMTAMTTRVPASMLLLAVDHQLRTPVHYAVRYGLAASTRFLLKLEPACLKFNDSDGAQPLDLAVIHRQPRTLYEILQYNVARKPSLLLTAARLNASKVCSVLIQTGGFDVNYRDESSTGETALHVAAKHNHLDTVKTLITEGANLEIRENTYSWTPIFLAAVDGSMEIAKALLSAGAKADIVDNSGWTAKEHAALRGHLDLAQILPEPPASPPSSGDESSSLARRKAADTQVLKTFGHRYLEDTEECLVLVTLGSRDLRNKSRPPVQLEEVPMSEAGKTQLDTALSLQVSATHSSSDPYPVDLPVPELGLATEPIPFFTKEPHKVNIRFDLVPTYSTGSQILARGVYIPPVVGKLQDLNRINQTVPILEAQSLRELGRVNFEMLIVKPFVHPSNGLNFSSTYWKSLITTRVIGHRGLGKNTLNTGSLQLGENTVESFIQAANLGASYVEFDVQLTKDNVPVIYHDFLVGDSGFDIPMNQMTKDQFMNIQRPVRGRQEIKDDESRKGSMTASSTGMTSSAATSPPSGLQDSNNGSGSSSNNYIDQQQQQQQRFKRSHSVHQFNRSADLDASYEDAVRRMQFTRDFKLKGFKGNVRGMHIHSKFATLEELFKNLPEGLGFNIEFKYPMLDEAEAEEMDCIVPEINHFVDTILKMIFDLKRERDIIISSFNPDICILLSLKQPSIPVLFLTEGGSEPMMDIRASCLQEAIRFARRFNLLGIVSEASPLIMCPRLVRAVKESGLVCFTYGVRNNVPENARIQLKAGVDAVIVDSVLAIRQELTNTLEGENEGDILVQEVSNAIEQAKINSS